MSETPDASEIIDSLKDYVERQKDLLEEDRDRLLKEGKEKFDKVLEEKQDLFAKSLEQLAAGKSKRQALRKTPALRSFLRQIKTRLRRVLFMKRPTQPYLLTVKKTEDTPAVAAEKEASSSHIS